MNGRQGISRVIRCRSPVPCVWMPAELPGEPVRDADLSSLRHPQGHLFRRPQSGIAHTDRFCYFIFAVTKVSRSLCIKSRPLLVPPGIAEPKSVCLLCGNCWPNAGYILSVSRKADAAVSMFRGGEATGGVPPRNPARESLPVLSYRRVFSCVSATRTSETEFQAAELIDSNSPAGLIRSTVTSFRNSSFPRSWGTSAVYTWLLFQIRTCCT